MSRVEISSPPVQRWFLRHVSAQLAENASSPSGRDTRRRPTKPGAWPTGKHIDGDIRCGVAAGVYGQANRRASSSNMRIFEQ